MDRLTPSDHVVLFDGKCGLCNRSVRLIHRNDPKRLFKFAHLQSDLAHELRHEYDIPGSVDSIIYIHNKKVHTKSSAALRIARKMRRLYPLLYGFMIIPKPIRDFFYDLIARNRHRFWKQSETCELPSPSLREQFIASPEIE